MSVTLIPIFITPECLSSKMSQSLSEASPFAKEKNSTYLCSGIYIYFYFYSFFLMEQLAHSLLYSFLGVSGVKVVINVVLILM